MEAQILLVEPQTLQQAASRYFDVLCGLTQAGEKAERMRARAYAVHALLQPAISLHILIVPLRPEQVEKDKIKVDNYAFSCIELQTLEPGSVKGLYGVVITAGELPQTGTTMSDTLYTDLWGTAYVNAASDFVQCRLREYGHEYISEGIGPGYYDMDSARLADFFQVVDGGKIGVTVADNMMLPVKSVAGFYLAFSDAPKRDFLKKRCLYCHNASRGCDFCKFTGQRVRGGRPGTAE